MFQCLTVDWSLSILTRMKSYTLVLVTSGTIVNLVQFLTHLIKLELS